MNGLWIVATPIGNLADMTPRAVEVLRAADLILAEDTRVTRKLLSHFDIHVPMWAWHAQSSPRELSRVSERLVEGASVALVSDAGTPLVSDPGRRVVAAAMDLGIPVRPVPGPSSVTAALSVCPISAPAWTFLGFLPRAAGDQRARVAPFRRVPTGLVIMESPNRVGSTARNLAAQLGDRSLFVARELTKRFEDTELSQLASWQPKETRGEYVLCVGGPSEAEMGDDDEVAADLDRHIRGWLAEGHGPSEVAKLVAGAMGIGKREAYQRVLQAQTS